MDKAQVHLAVDLGAGSGRVVGGIYDGKTLKLVEFNRFSNDAVKEADGSHWNFDKLLRDIKQGIAVAVQKHGDAVVSIGVDTWGVDYGLIDAKGKLICAPFQYRDARTNGMKEKAFGLMPRREIYERTGIQFMFFNTLFQLLADKNLDKAAQMLFMPDLVHYFLTGERVNEKTIASTSQLMSPHKQEWDKELIRAMGFPERIFGKLVDAGTVLGGLLPEIAKETGAKNLRVIAPAGHDTGSAVVGVPSEESEPVFLSSGTWSIIGRELSSPKISDESFAASFSNEGGVFGTTRFLKNIAGMWLLQECKRAWDGAGKADTYDGLIAQAKGSSSFKTFVDPDAADFQAPASMPAAIAKFCERTGQAVPADCGEYTRMILESLALKYRTVKDSLARVTGKPVDKIYMVGGGCQNHLLNQFAADAMNCPVICEPVEATSIGNIIMQLYALGEVSSLAEGRAVARRSFGTKTFEPKDTARWDDAYGRFEKITQAK
ncbi:MAG TPA: rhamnulokinase family protein [Verrucomicrobiae bacterium]|jgi:sugar (pentulose or hexulose) kinase